MKKHFACMLAASMAGGIMAGAMLAGCNRSDSGQGSGEKARPPMQQSFSNEEDGADGQKMPSAKAATIRFSTQSMTDKTAPVLLSILDQFRTDNPNVKLEIEESPGNDLITKINTDIMGDNAPDIFTFWRPESKWNVDKYIEKGALADLTELVKTDPFFTELFPEYAWKTATVDGRIYCIPRLSFYVEFLVNKDLFEQHSIPLPTDWESLAAACVQLKANGIIPWCVDTKEGLDDSSRIFNAVINGSIGNEKGLELLKGKESFKQDDVIKALDCFLEVVSGNGPEDGSALDFNQAISKYLNTGKAGMTLGNCSQIDKNLNDDILGCLTAMNFPFTPFSIMTKPSLEQDLTNLVYISSKAYADPDKKEYVINLMKRMVSAEAAKRYVEEERLVVPHLNLNIDPARISPLQLQAASIAETSTGDKWLLSFAKPGPVDDFRIVVNESWSGKYASGKELADALDGALYQK